MRPLVTPPPASYCNLCGGELRLKRAELADREFGTQSEVFVCVSCGREQTFTVQADRYTATSAHRSMPGR